MMTALSVLAATVLLSVDRPAGVFTDLEVPSVSVLQRRKDIRWTLRDAELRILDEGTCPASGRVTFPNLKNGYYRLSAETPGGEREEVTFCRVADPSKRTYPRDSFYGVDAAHSELCVPGNYTCAWGGTNVFATVMDLIRKAGIVHVRDRLYWWKVAGGDASPFVENARLAQARGLDVSPLDHSAPPCSKPVMGCPTDLSSVYAFAAWVGRTYGDALGCYEFSNEPDIDYWKLPVWDYAAALKAAYLGLKSVRPNVPVLNGAVATGARTAYNRGLVENDLVRYSDVFNFHQYQAPSGLSATHAAFADFLSANGLGDRQMWVTESSVTIEGLSTADGKMPGKKAHSVEQELVMAETYPKVRALMQMGGVARDYCFVFGPFNERRGAMDWGIQRRDGSVKPIYAALAAMTENLVDAKIVGERDVGKDARCFVFRKSNGTYAVLCWALSPCDRVSGNEEATPRQWQPCSTVVRLPAADGTYRGAGIFGTPLQHQAKGGELKLVVSRYPQYVLDLPEIGVDKKPIRQVGKIGGGKLPSDGDPTIVLRIELDSSDFSITDRKTAAEWKGGKGRVKLHVWNLSRRKKRGRLSVEGATIGGLDPELTVEAMAETSLDAILTPIEGNPVSSVRIGGCFEGQRISPLVFPLKTGSGPIVSGKPKPLSALADPKAWTRNDSAAQTTITWDEKEKAVRFDCTWPASVANRWFYPRHALTEAERQMILDADYLGFEVKIAQDKVENDVKEAYVMFVYPDGQKPIWKSYVHPIGNWEQRFVPVKDHDGSSLPSDLRSLAVGCNPAGTQLTFWIRGIQVFK